MDKSNIVWLNASDITCIANESNVQTAFLWGSHDEGELCATLVKLPVGFNGEIKNLSPNFRAVIIQGTILHQVSNEKNTDILEGGAYFGAAENSTHKISVK